MILHHRSKISTSKKAIKYAKLSLEKGYNKGKWLIASSTDRLLQLQGKPQKFGTQVVNMKAKNLKLHKLDPKTTDEERKKYGLPTLKELKKYLKKHSKICTMHSRMGLFDRVDQMSPRWYCLRQFR